jgi:hypothetical protein
MGYNTTIVLYNDALDQIEKDPQLGRSIGAAVRQVACRYGAVDVPAGNHSNAMRVIESHHADTTALVAVGANTGSVLRNFYGFRSGDLDWQESMLKTWLAEVQREKAKLGRSR